MTKIKHMVDDLKEELEGAKKYAEQYIECKVKGNGSWANRYKEMATDELKHAMYIHERLVMDIDELSKVYTPPQEMKEKWEKDHTEYIEKAAWIKQMLTM